MYYTIQAENNEGTDQTAHIQGLRAVKDECDSCNHLKDIEGKDTTD